MQSTQEAYNDILSSDNHWYEAAVRIGEKGGYLIHPNGDKLVFGYDDDGTPISIEVDDGSPNSGYGEEWLFSLATQSALFSDDEPTVGSAVSSEIDLQIFKPTADIPRMAKIEVYVRIANNGAQSEWLNRGTFFVDTREATQNTDDADMLTLHGYDAMLKFEQDYGDDKIAGDADGKRIDIDMVKYMAAAVGIAIDERTTKLMDKGYKYSLPVGYSMREVLGYIAGSYGGNFIISDENQLLLITLSGLPEETSLLTDYLGNALIFGDTRINLDYTEVVM